MYVEFNKNQGLNFVCLFKIFLFLVIDFYCILQLY